MELTTKDHFNHEQINLIRNTVALGATDLELQLFLATCKAAELDPLKKEVWFIKTKEYTTKDGKKVPARVQIMTGINGFLAVANSYPEFDGIESDVVIEGGKIIYAWAKVWRKDRRFPAYAKAYLTEYYKPGNYGKESVWDKMPAVMLTKCAKSMALREAFPAKLNGLYTEEEMPAIYSRSAIDVTPVDPDTSCPAKSLPASAVTPPVHKDKVGQVAMEQVPMNVPGVKIETLNKATGEITFVEPVQWKAVPTILDKFVFRYHLPYQKEGWDMADIRKMITKDGGKYNRKKSTDKATGVVTINEHGDDMWYTNVWYPDMMQYARDPETLKKVENLTTPTQSGPPEDNLPDDWFGSIVAGATNE